MSRDVRARVQMSFVVVMDVTRYVIVFQAKDDVHLLSEVATASRANSDLS